MKIIKKIGWIMLCLAIFIGVFGISAYSKAKNIFGGEFFAAFALQGASTKETLSKNEYNKRIIDVKYIKADSTIDTRQVIIYKPSGATGDLPLIYIPHYSAEENTADFVSYIRHGWAVAAPYQFKNDFNGVLETDDLVFNNATLYTLRHMDSIDKKRISIIGGSAGGYTALMLNGLQMGTVASIASAPIANVYFNFHEYFPMADEVNRNSGLFDFKMPIQGMISKAFQPINDKIKKDDVRTWEAISPVSMANAISNPLVMVHNTSDILVPVDQITHKYTYAKNDGTLPKEFVPKLPSTYPGILSSTFEEMANPDELTIKHSKFNNNHIEGVMPYANTLITININDDGPATAKGSHSAPNLTGSYDIFPYLEDMMKRTLDNTEKLVPQKLLLLLERYQGESLALPAHEGVDDTVYGSLAIYQREIVDELKMWMDSHTKEEMDSAMKSAVSKISDSNKQQKYNKTWQVIFGQIK
ncbi:alpha/beta hydrolase family protein [Inconstantimicrobium mannanitabidum]|uniref:Uncharacterized protein n=1 Tax=Inconstantimicrobium mannanitabidum TaxID=1604901 RepID=A0ACB5RCC9_9CLOT|nr:hypothetical protein [Clostridium sp. TW13]GKX66534.1 hypothetical protein rsdtw13_17920 [Clostridium sp. TW13]